MSRYIALTLLLTVALPPLAHGSGPRVRVERDEANRPVAIAIRGDVKRTDLAKLGEMTELRRIDLICGTSTPVQVGDFNVLKQLRKLTTVVLYGGGVNRQVVRIVGDCPSVKRIALMDSQLDDSVFEELSELRLELLEIYSPNITGGELWQLGKQADLFHLDLRGKRVGTHGLEAIATFQSLKTLALWQSAVNDSHLPVFSQLPRLEELYLARSDVTAKGLSKVKWPKSIRKVVIDWTPENLTNFRSPLVREIDLTGNSLKDETLLELCKLQPDLEFINLSETDELTDLAIEHLLTLKNLRTVRLGSSGISYDGMESLKRRRPDVRVQGNRTILRLKASD
jgi:hypothetical protein